MSDILRTFIIPADQADLARTIAATLDPVNCSDMFRTPLSATGTEPVTHFITSGPVSQAFAALVPYSVWQWQTPDLDETGEWVEVEHRDGHPEKTHEMCIEAGLDVPLAAIEVLYLSSDVTNEDPFVAMGRRGLQLAWPVEPTDEPEAS